MMREPTKAEILVFEDDPSYAGLAETVLREAGYSTHWASTGLKALETIQDYQPRLVVLDIMMPGMDGVSLCRLIKSTPATKAVKVVINSSKGFKEERERVARAGADAFLEKFSEGNLLLERVRSLIGNPTGLQAQPAAALKVGFWGCHSEPDPANPPKGPYQTSCVYVQGKSVGVILDAGTGFPALLQRLTQTAPPQTLWLFLSHFHPDHVQGLRMLSPGALKGLILQVAFPSDLTVRAEEFLQSSFQRLGVQPNQIRMFQIQERTYQLAADFQLSTLYMNHPGATLGMSLELEGRKVVYCPANELSLDSGGALGDFQEKITMFCRRADFLIHDSRYSQEDYVKGKGEGYSTWAPVVDLAVRSGARKLALFHVDPRYDEPALKMMESQAQEKIRSEMTTLECVVARAGLVLEV